MRKYYGLLLIIIWFGCANPVENRVEYHYFNLETYVDSLLFLDCPERLHKKIKVNEVASDTTVTVIDAKADLSFLDNFSIDKPNYYGQYQIDTVREASGILITYTATNKRFKVKEITIRYTGDTIDQVMVHYINRNFLVDDEDLITLSSCNVLIKQNNKPLIGERDIIEITYKTTSK